MNILSVSLFMGDKKKKKKVLVYQSENEQGFSYGVQCILKSFNFRPTSKGIVRCYLVFTFMFVRKLHAANPRVYICKLIEKSVLYHYPRATI